VQGRAAVPSHIAQRLLGGNDIERRSVRPVVLQETERVAEQQNATITFQRRTTELSDRIDVTAQFQRYLDGF